MCFVEELSNRISRFWISPCTNLERLEKNQKQNKSQKAFCADYPDINLL